MASNRNYGPVPQAPNSPNFNPILLNTQAKNAAVLPVTFPAPLASEQFITNPALAARIISYIFNTSCSTGKRECRRNSVRWCSPPFDLTRRRSASVLES